MDIQVLYSVTDIRDRVKQLADIINNDYKEDIVIIAVLKGSFIFMADLVRNIIIDNKIDFIDIKSYNKTQRGEITMNKDIQLDITNKDIIVVEDIIDTGHSLKYIDDYLKQKNCRSIQYCCLLDKKCKREVDIPIKYVGFECEDKFVIGYGLDYDEKYRNLPYIGHVLNNCL